MTVRKKWPKIYLYVHARVHCDRYEAKKRGGNDGRLRQQNVYYVAPQQRRQQAAARAWCMWCMGPSRQHRTAGTRRYVPLTAVCCDTITQEAASKNMLSAGAAVKIRTRYQIRTYETNSIMQKPQEINALIHTRAGKKL